MIKDSPIISKTGRYFRLFDNNADRRVLCLVRGGYMHSIIKEVRQSAPRNNDPYIYAVLKVVQCHGGTYAKYYCTKSTSQLQTNVIQIAWENSRIDPANVRVLSKLTAPEQFLGDPIEFAGVSSAFEGLVEGEKWICSMSSVRGPSWAFTGPIARAGTDKTSSCVKEASSPVWICWAESPYKRKGTVTIQRNLDQMGKWWDTPFVLVGVSSYGLTGTNMFIAICWGNIMQSKYQMPSIIYRMLLN